PRDRPGGRVDRRQRRPLEARRAGAAVRQRERRQGRGAGRGNAYLDWVMSSAVTVPKEAPERHEPPFNPALVEELLRQLDKAVRAHQLYMHKHPTYLKSLESLRAAFAPVWAETDSLSLSITDLQFTWCGVPVHEQ